MYMYMYKCASRHNNPFSLGHFPKEIELNRNMSSPTRETFSTHTHKWKGGACTILYNVCKHVFLLN